MLFDLDDDVDLTLVGAFLSALDMERVVNWRQVAALELHVHNGPDDLNDLARFHIRGCCICHIQPTQIPKAPLLRTPPQSALA